MASKLKVCQNGQNTCQKVKKNTSPKKNRGIVWPDEATDVLIELWAEETIQIALQNAKCAKETREVYRRISVQMENRGFLFRLDDIINKMKKLRQKYKVEKDKSNKSGTGKKKPWKYFSKMDAILGTRPNTQPPQVIDTSFVEYDNGHIASDSEEDHESVQDGKTSDKVSDIVKQPEESLKDGEEPPDCSEIADYDDLEKPISSVKRNSSVETCKQPVAKRKKMSNFEKGIALMCNTLNETSERELERSLKAESERYQKEMDFQLKMMELENQRRIQEREHEMRFICLLMGNNRQNQNVPQPLIHYPNQLPNNFSAFSPSSSYINQLNSTPLNVSDTSSDTSSSNIEEGLHSYYSL